MTAPISSSSWHRWLVERSYRSCGQETLPEFSRFGYVLAVIGSGLFIACAGLICIVLNAGALLFGIAVEPIWTGRDKFHVLRLPGNIPLVTITLPILAVYGIWRSSVDVGLVTTLAPFVVTALMGVGMFACVISYNRLRGR